MTLGLTDATVDGLRRVLTRTGGILFALLLATQLLVTVSVNTLLVAAAPPEATTMIGLTLPVGSAVAGVLLLGTLVFTALYFVLVARALVRPHSQLSSFPSELYTHRIGRATLSMFAGGVVVFFAVAIGLVFLILPGLFVAASFLFFMFAIGVEDRGALAGLGRSWELSRGNRLRLVLLAVLIGLGGAVVGAIPTLLQQAGAPVAGDLLSVVLNGTLFTFVYGIMAAAYLQVTDDGPDSRDGSEPSPAGSAFDVDESLD